MLQIVNEPQTEVYLMKCRWNCVLVQVYSSYRFVLHAYSKGKNIAIVTIGQTRADDMAQLKIEARCSDVLLQIRR